MSIELLLSMEVGKEIIGALCEDWIDPDLATELGRRILANLESM